MQNRETLFRCPRVGSHDISQASRNSGGGSSHVKNEVIHPNCTVGSDNLWNMESSLPLNQGYGRPTGQNEVSSWPNFHPDVPMVQPGQPNSLGNHFFPINWKYMIPVEKQNHHLPFWMFSQGYPHEIQHQNFQYFLVIDFEATCEKGRKIHPQEIIEFPCVIVNGVTGELEASFQTYVQPVYHQVLTDYCKELTGIQQLQVDRGVTLSEALIMHDDWLERKGVKHTNFAVVTWGDWDCRTMLESECRLKKIRKPPYFDRWINLKAVFQEFGGIRCDLKEAVQRAGLVFEGRHHSGIDDARNIASLLSLLMCRGYCFSITNSLATPNTPSSCPTNQPQAPGTAGPARVYQCSVSEENDMKCLCGVMSSQCMVRKPGPMQGRWFFGCGNWTPERGAVCNYFEWASPETE